MAEIQACLVLVLGTLIFTLLLLPLPLLLILQLLLLLISPKLTLVGF